MPLLVVGAPAHVGLVGAHDARVGVRVRAGLGHWSAPPVTLSGVHRLGDLSVVLIGQFVQSMPHLRVPGEIPARP